MLTVRQRHCARRRDFSQRPCREILNPFRGIIRKICREIEQTGGVFRNQVRTATRPGQIGARLTRGLDPFDLLRELSRRDYPTRGYGKPRCFQCLRDPGVACVEETELLSRRIEAAVGV